MKQHQDVSNNDNVIIYGKIKDSTNSSTIQIVIMKKNIDSNGVVVTISIIKIIQIKINVTDNINNTNYVSEYSTIPGIIIIIIFKVSFSIIFIPVFIIIIYLNCQKFLYCQTLYLHTFMAAKVLID